MSYIAPTDNFSILAFLFLAVAIGIVGEHRGWFGKISGVLVTLMLGALFVSFNILPSGSDQSLNIPVYNFAFEYLIPFSIPLLLFNIELKRIFAESGRLMILFLIGAVGVVAGAILASMFIDLGEETYKVAGVFTATYTGGSVNFFAVGDSFNFLESDLFAATIVVDNVFTILFIMILFLLPKVKAFQNHFPPADKSVHDTLERKKVNASELLEKLSLALVITSVIVAISMWLSPHLEKLLQTDIKLDALLITVIVLLAANIFPKFLRPLEEVAFQFGMLLLFLFLAVIGATCNLGDLFTSSPKILIFAIIVLFVHLTVTIVAGKLLKFSLEDIAIASGANAGGVSISAPMAATFEMKKTVTPAILVGIMGYVVGTFLGLAVGQFLS